MELDHLHTFFVVAKELGFSKAAKRLRVQQPTVSKTVQNLEATLGVKLFERTKRSVRLTSDGNEIFKICQTVFSGVDQIDEYLKSNNKTLKGDLRLGASDSLATHVLPLALKKFLKLHPFVRPSLFSASSTAIGEELLRGELEFGLYFTQPDSRYFDAEEIATIPFVLVGHSAFVERKDRMRHFIASRENEYRGERSFPVREMLMKKGLTSSVAISTNNLEAQKRMILLGLGVGLLPFFMVKKEVESGLLKSILPKADFSFSLKRVTKKGKVLSRAAEVFLDGFLNELNRMH
jgi:DNA-binding transcriptional LysR family regulator